jgi:uncharacterized membrane protein YjjP (DUF1212 family)
VKDNKSIDFPKADKYPRWLSGLAIAIGLLFFVLFAYFGDPLRGFAASLSAGAMVIIVITLWDLKNYVMYWLMILVAGASHVLFIYSLTGHDFRFPGIVFTPLVILDFVFWQYATVSVVRALKI